MNFKPFAVAALFLLLSLLGFSQSIVVPEMASLAQDTVVRKELISSLTGFLAEKDSPIKSNEYVLNGTLPETSALLDEMKAVEQSNRFNDKNFYKCHLTNFVKLEGNNYLIQFSYIGIDN
ncbi:MAG: hypothetical protein ACXVJB_13080, partial [Mucilaginibacter sp.]